MLREHLSSPSNSDLSQQQAETNMGVAYRWAEEEVSRNVPLFSSYLYPLFKYSKMPFMVDYNSGKE